MNTRRISFRTLTIIAFLTVATAAFAFTWIGLPLSGSEAEASGAPSRAAAPAPAGTPEGSPGPGACELAGTPIEVFASGGGPPATGYPTLKDAFDAINAGTHTGAIQIDVCGNTTETASAVLNSGAVAPASYTSLSIRPVNASRIIEGTIVGAVVKLNGADNVTIDGRQFGMTTGRALTVRNNSTATATAAVWLASVAAGNGASNNIIRNLELAAGADQRSSTSITFGIIMSGTAISTTSNGVDNDNNSFIANRVIRTRYGILTRGTTTDLNINPVVSQNIIGPDAFGPDQLGKTGIFMQADTGATVSQNTVQNVGVLAGDAAGGSDRCGICIGTESWSVTDASTLTSLNYTVVRNVVRNIVEEKTFSVMGIKLGTTQSGGVTGNLVANNFIINSRSNGTLGDQFVGIGIAGGNGDRVVFNSISITGDVDPGAAAASSTWGSGIRIPGANAANNANLTVMDNSIYMDVNSNTATQHYFAITLNSSAYLFGTGGLNYNNYFINAGNPQMRTGGLGTATTTGPGTEFTDLAAWKLALTTPQDANSIQADPLHFSITSDLHVPTNSPNVNAGLAVAGITDDIDGDTRPAGPNPDIGADESLPSPGSVQFTSATFSVSESGMVAAITAFRAGGVNGAVTVDFATVAGGTGTGGASCSPGVDYVNSNTTFSWADLEGGTKTFNVPICADGVLESPETVNLALSNPTGGVTLGSPSTGVLTINDAGSTFNGPFNVGSGQAITSLTNPGGAFDAINNGNVTGNITINVTSDLTGETGVIALNELAGGFGLTLKPSGAARSISGSSGAAIIHLNDADNVVIDGSLSGGTDRSLTITNTSTAANTAAIWLSGVTNGAQSNTVKNTILSGGFDQSTGSVFNFAIIASAGTILTGGTDLDNNTYTNNFIKKVSVGIISIGGLATNMNQNTVISNNTIGPAAFGSDQISTLGVLIFNENAPQIVGNEIRFIGDTATTGGSSSRDHVGISLCTGSASWSSTTAPTIVGNVTGANVSRNLIHDIVERATFSAVGIVENCPNTAPTQNVIANNMIYNVQANGTSPDQTVGIGLSNGNGDTVAFNTIALSGDIDPGTATSATISSHGISIGFTAVQNPNLRDNISLMDITSNTATVKNSSINIPTAYSFGTGGMDFNDLFPNTGNAQANVGSVGGTAGTFHATLPAWQAATMQDTNSKAVDPVFVSPTDLHLQAGSTLINMGTAVMGITTDFDGQPRDAMPDIGADEFVVLVPGTLQFSSATYTVGEAGPTATITITRTGGTDGAVTVDYATVAGGTATGGASCAAGIDYVNTSGTAMFADGSSTSQTFTVTICQDAVFKVDETINLALTNPTGGATLGTPNTAVLTITNDDNPPFSGSVNVGTGETFTSLTNAGGLFEAINAAGASSNLTINITSDLTGENGTVALNEIAGGFTVLIKPVGAARTITGASTTGILKFSGADGVTIDGSLAGATAADVVGGDDMIRNLTVQNTSTTATSGAVVAVFQGTNGANNFTIKNTKVLGQDPTQTLVGIHVGGNTVGTSPTVVSNNARIENCSIRKAILGTFTNGVTATPATGTVITKNSYGSAVATDRLRRGGIFFFNQDGIQVTLNDIAGIDSNESADSIGIIAGIQNVTTTTTTAGGVTNANISRNRINGVKASSTVGFSAVGIAIAGGTTGPNVIANNMISGVIGNPTSPDIIAGIFVTGVTSSDTRVFFNSVSLTGDRGAVASQIGGYGIAITGATPVVQLRDNIFLNTQISGGGVNAKSYSIGMVANAFTNYNSNFNDFFASGANAGFFRTNGLGATGTDFATLAAFQAATAQEANSQEVDPLFVDPTSNLHLQPTSPVLDDGTPAGGITVDFDGDARNATTPDIGADEIAGAAGALQFSSATYTVGEAGPTATITITRTGGTTGAVTVDYATVAGGTATGGASCAAGIDYVNTNGTAMFADGSSTSQTFTVTICQDAVFKVDETINLALTNPTGGATLGTPNTAVLTITNDDNPPFSGTINVGTGETFTSLTLPGGLFEAINTSGASSNLTINITSDLTGENGTVALNEIAGGFTVLIKPSGAARSITGAATGGTGAILKFNGADGVTIDGSLTGATAADVVGGDDSIRNLTIQNTSATGTAAGVVAAFQGPNGANNFTIKNTKVLGADPIQTLVGIHVGGNTVGASPTIVNNNARIENCSIRKAILGTFTNGVTATPATGTVITKNSYGSLVATDRLRRGGIFFFNQNGIQVTLNDIAGIDSNESADSIGIIAGNQAISTTTTTAGGVSNANISRNRINGVKASSTVGFSAAGIAVGGGTLGPNVIANNMITGVIGNATSPDLIAGIFIVGATGSDTRAYFNSVSMTGDRGAVASQLPSYGIAITGATPVVDLKDNIFYNTQISGGGANAKSYSIGMVATVFTNFNSNFNDFFASGANAGFFRTGSLAAAAGTDYATLAAFQAATASDANSKEVDPLFVDPTMDVHLLGTSTLIDMGVSAGGISVDFDGDMRPIGMQFDIGADERAATAPVPAQLAGQVLTSDGAGIRNVIVSITCSCLAQPQRVYTSSFGYYHFDNLQTGQTYTVSVASKRFVFAMPSQMVVLNGDVNNINFTANPQ